MKSILIFSFLSLFVFTSCQDEITELPDEQESETITASSEVAELVSLTTLRDGSIDNIIDRANCSTVVFPVTVSIHGIEIIIDSEEDLQLIENLYDEFEDDIDELDILFPITVILSDHTEVVIQSNDHLGTIIAQCSEDDDDIECVDFEYPISISVFDANNEIAETKTFDNDERLYHFFQELNENEFVSFNFPMKLIDSEGTRIVIENNNQLEEALRVAKNECDEDDDNDYNDDDFDLERLNNYLVDCSWIVNHVRRNATNQTDLYSNGYLVFRENGTVEAKLSSGDIEGTWETNMTNQGAVIALDFTDLPNFSNEWIVYEIGDETIKFYENDDNKIILEKRCLDTFPVYTADQFNDVISGCSWTIAHFTYNEEDVTSQYESYYMSFNYDGSMIITNGQLTAAGELITTGNWMSYFSDFGVDFIWNVNESLDELSNDWRLIEMSDDRVMLNSGNGYIILEKDCNVVASYLAEDLLETFNENGSNDCVWMSNDSSYYIKPASNTLLDHNGTFIGYDIYQDGSDIYFTFDTNTWKFVSNLYGTLNFVDENGTAQSLILTCSFVDYDVVYGDFLFLIGNNNFRIKSITQQGNDVTAELDGYVFTFRNEIVTATDTLNGDEVYTGTLFTFPSGNHEITMGIDFGTDAPLDLMNNLNWTFSAYQHFFPYSNFPEFKLYSGSDSVTFEKVQ